MNEKKIKAIEAYHKNGDSLRKIARDLKTDKMVVSCWLETYRFHGLKGLLAPACLSYDDSFKLKVVKHMIETIEPYSVVAGRFKIPSRATIWKWMHRYMSEEEWALYHLKRERRDMKKRQVEKVQTEAEKLQEELEFLRAENAYLKKLHALVQEKEQLKQKKK